MAIYSLAAFAGRDWPALEKVDAILDKISKEGIHSLTAAEKKQLEDARAKLLQKDRQGR